MRSMRSEELVNMAAACSQEAHSVKVELAVAHAEQPKNSDEEGHEVPICCMPSWNLAADPYEN